MSVGHQDASHGPRPPAPNRTWVSSSAADLPTLKTLYGNSDGVNPSAPSSATLDHAGSRPARRLPYLTTAQATYTVDLRNDTFDAPFSSCFPRSPRSPRRASKSSSSSPRHPPTSPGMTNYDELTAVLRKIPSSNRLYAGSHTTSSNIIVRNEPSSSSRPSWRATFRSRSRSRLRTDSELSSSLSTSAAPMTWSRSRSHRESGTGLSLRRPQTSDGVGRWTRPTLAIAITDRSQVSTIELDPAWSCSDSDHSTSNSRPISDLLRHKVNRSLTSPAFLTTSSPSGTVDDEPKPFQHHDAVDPELEGEECLVDEVLGPGEGVSGIYNHRRSWSSVHGSLGSYDTGSLRITTAQSHAHSLGPLSRFDSRFEPGSATYTSVRSTHSGHSTKRRPRGSDRDELGSAVPTAAAAAASASKYRPRSTLAPKRSFLLFLRESTRDKNVDKSRSSPASSKPAPVFPAQTSDWDATPRRKDTVSAPSSASTTPYPLAPRSSTSSDQRTAVSLGSASASASASSASLALSSSYGLTSYSSIGTVASSHRGAAAAAVLERPCLSLSRPALTAPPAVSAGHAPATPTAAHPRADVVQRQSQSERQRGASSNSSYKPSSAHTKSSGSGGTVSSSDVSGSGGARSQDNRTRSLTSLMLPPSSSSSRLRKSSNTGTTTSRKAIMEADQAFAAMFPYERRFPTGGDEAHVSSKKEQQQQQGQNRGGSLGQAVGTASANATMSSPASAANTETADLRTLQARFHPGLRRSNTTDGGGGPVVGQVQGDPAPARQAAAVDGEGGQGGGSQHHEPRRRSKIGSKFQAWLDRL
ncbi:hypothetical protein V8E36_001949 [Tilletia maclaganii]